MAVAFGQRAQPGSGVAVHLAAVAQVVGQGHRQVRYRHLPGADHLIAGHQTGDGAITDGDQKGLIRYLFVTLRRSDDVHAAG